MIDSLKAHYPISRLSTYLKVSRSGYYAWCKEGRPLQKHWDKLLAKKIQIIFDSSFKGYRYIWMQLKRYYNIVVDPKTVLRYMHVLGLRSPIRKKRFKSCTRQERNKKARQVSSNFLAREFTSDRPNQKLVTDVSYLYHKSGRLFLSVVKDLYDNSIVAYHLSKFNDNKLVFDNLDKIFNASWDSSLTCLLHSDQGFKYTNRFYHHKLEDYNVTVSHSRKGNCYDNACCENFFSHLKSESLELFIPEDEQSLIQQVEDYITWYNTDRPQLKLKGMTPLEYREAYLAALL